MSQKNQNSVRINAGIWRSRILKFPDVLGLRPTPERVRQTVFNWLGQDLNSLHCLDLFAGTGVMGFEALSRNAKSATMVENAKSAFDALLASKQLLQAENAHLILQDAISFLQSLPLSQRFDVVFLDPPYYQSWLAKVLPLVKPYLNEGAYVYVEAEYSLESQAIHIPNFTHDWQIVKHKKAGNVFYHLLAAL